MKNQKPQTERSQEKFPKTRTFPEGWDMANSENMTNGNSPQTPDAGHQPGENQETQDPRSPEKFPKTTTMPSGWIF
jgi:hypothetical protein